MANLDWLFMSSCFFAIFKEANQKHVAQCFRHKTKQINILSMQLSRAVIWENEQCGVSEIFPCLRIRLAV